MPPGIDIAMCMNRAQFRGAMAAIHSILRNAVDRAALRFHLVVGAGESPEFETWIRECLADRSIRYEITEFRPDPMLADYILAGQPHTYATGESQALNFSRFYLPHLCPGLGKVIYLDADLIVRGDIAELHRLGSLETHVIAAVPDGTFESWEEYLRPGSGPLAHIESHQPTFNAGVYVTDLGRWRKEGVLERLEGWIRTHRLAMEAFYFGTQSIMNLAFYRGFQPLPSEWNVQPLGWHDDIPEERLRGAKILHWSGKRKPWLPDGLYRDHWLEYAVDRRTP
jgi:alpha-1,4-galacturonosyltransferase